MLTHPLVVFFFVATTTSHHHHNHHNQRKNQRRLSLLKHNKNYLPSSSSSCSSNRRLLSLRETPKTDKESGQQQQSRWQRRTEKRRKRTEELLDSIENGTTISSLPLLLQQHQHHHHHHQSLLSSTTDGSLRNSYIPTLHIPQSSRIDWDNVGPELDPIRGGKLQHKGSGMRGLRKRAQVEAFHFVVSTILDRKNIIMNDNNALSHDDYDNDSNNNNNNNNKNAKQGVTIIDAGCGAGNLAISLAGLLYCDNGPGRSDDIIDITVLAVDVNEQALKRLSRRAEALHLPPGTKIETCLADLADYDLIRSKIPPHHSVVVVSLHACGAATDMAMNLSFRCNNAPFIVCPCCTAKSLTKRSIIVPEEEEEGTGEKKNRTTFDLSASFQRSGASMDIEYPRSAWLRNKFGGVSNKMTFEEIYSNLAKVADVGLGPQTPYQQRQQQARSKKIIELDRLMAASEGYGYDVKLMRISDHDPYVYGKGDLLIGGKDISELLINLPEE